jgi:uncharacterized protein (TIGR02453 family)
MEALDFFEGLEADNSKTYWTEHRATYDEQVLAPMVELLAELEDEFGPTKVFRPYRDVRFSADKTPYKTNLGAMLGNGYVQLTAAGLAAGLGMYQLAPDQLVRYREAVAGEASGAQLDRVIATIERAGIRVHGHGVLKTVPRGYDKAHPRAELLKNKGLTAWWEWPPAAWLSRPTARNKVADFMRTSAPLMSWLDTHVGPSTAPERRR